MKFDYFTQLLLIVWLYMYALQHFTTCKNKFASSAKQNIKLTHAKRQIKNDLSFFTPTEI